MMVAIKVNEDLQREREKGTFNTEELTNLIDGGKEKTAERRELVDFFVRDPVLKDPIPFEYLSYVERYEESVRKNCLLFYKINEWQELKQNSGSIDLYSAILGGMLGSAIFNDGMPFHLHFVMFIPTLMGQGTVEQQAHWISKAWNCQILGTYAQTELGHGTFIRGLETTAHYDPDTQEFILNSPTLTSYKWWPGGLGHTANHAIVVAQLYTKGVCHGIHPFIVQLRDLETHEPLPGIIIGEIGCKLGMNGANNGYLGFDHFRIPRNHMLMKNSKVLKDGTFVKSSGDKLTYGTMIFVRVALIKGLAAAYLSKAVCIATRYSCVRRQSELRPGEPEPIILEYKTQQYKLFPHLSSVFAMVFAAKWIWDLYNNVSSDLDQGDLEGLPELHALSCCLKAVCTSDSARGIDECRRACGGHGFMTCSSFPTCYGMATAGETYEGENTVLLLQTARFLMKSWQKLKACQTLASTVKYLERHSERRLPWMNDLVSLVTAFQQVATGLIKDVTELVDKDVASGHIQEDVCNSFSNRLVIAAEFHARSFLMRQFCDVLSTPGLSSELRDVLGALCELYGVYWLLKYLGYFLLHSNVRASDVPELMNWQEKLLEEIRPNAVSLVDSFDIVDEILASPLGAWDGNVYERLFDEAQRSPLNAKPVNESFHKYLKPFLNSNL